MLLIIQERGRHPENREYRECECLARAFGRLKVPCVVTGQGYESFAAWDELIACASSVLVLENYGMMKWLPRSLKHFPGPKTFWCIDSHVALGRHLQECDTFLFDRVLCSVAVHAGRFGKAGTWLPNAFPADLIMPLQAPSVHDVGFCGSWVRNRKEFYDAVSRQVPVHYDIRVLGDAMVRAIRGYSIHLNRNYSIDLNYRTYETMGAGTFLLTNKTDRLLDLFKPGIHLATYDTVADCVEQIHYYLKDPIRRMHVERAGAKEVHANHSYDARARWMVEKGVAV